MPKRQKKYKTKFKVVDTNTFQGQCSCGWTGSKMAALTDLSATLAAVQSETQAHKHIPAPPKEKKSARAK